MPYRLMQVGADGGSAARVGEEWRPAVDTGVRESRGDRCMDREIGWGVTWRPMGMCRCRSAWEESVTEICFC